MATLYEYYITGDDDNYYAADAQWVTQTFTPSITHTISSVKLLIYKGSGGGTVATVAIRATDGDGKPTGSNLCSGTFTREDLTASTSGEWKEVALSSCTVIANIKYAIVLSVAGAAADAVHWRKDISGPTYAGGSAGGSDDSGATWTLYAHDHMFEEWGVALLIGDRTVVGNKVTLEAIRNIEIVYGGRFYVDKSGNAKYESRYNRYV